MLKAKHPFLALSLKVAELCKPLEAFGIHHFTYLKHFKNGHRISLSNKPQWIKDYYNLNLYKSSLFEKPSGILQPSFNVWFGDYELDVYQHGKLYYNTMHSISITESQNNYTESFLFATTPDNPQAIHFLSNHREILYHFILYLKDRGLDIFKSAEKNKITIFSSLSDKQKNPSQENPLQDPLWLSQMEKYKKLFFHETPLRRFNFEAGEFKGIKLTQREIQCVFYLINHKTAAETGELMNISRRTVESYLDNLKLKLGCDSKSVLFNKLKNNPYLLALK